MTPDNAIVVVPPSRIVINGGRVTLVEEWCRWNGEPWVTIEIGREEEDAALRAAGEFYSHIGCPSQGNCKRGCLDEVLEPLHPVFRAKYRALFQLQNPDQAVIRELGFQHKVEILSY